MNGGSGFALHRVFVYGTLMPGERNAHAAGAGFTAARATLPGHALYHLEPEGYPVLRPDVSAAPVRGWVYTYTPEAWAAALPILDVLEGIHEVPPLYTRERAEVLTDAAGRVAAWVYVYAQPQRIGRAGAVRVTGGDWTRRGVLDTSGPSS